MDYAKEKFDWWRDKRAGKTVPLHDIPMQGYYAWRPSKNQPPLPVAIWYNKNGDLCVKVGSEMKANGASYWLGCMRNDISYEVYKDVAQAGQPWPNELVFEAADGSTESTMAGHNSGDDDETLRENIREWTERARRALKKGNPETQAEADIIADLATKLHEMSEEGAQRRVKEGKPHFEAHREITGKWNAFISPAEEEVKRLKAAGAVFARAEKKRREDEAREAARVAKEAGQDPAGITVTAAPVRMGTRGKAVTMVKQSYVDYGEDKRKGVAAGFAFLGALENVPPDVMDVVDKALKRILTSGIPIPGLKLGSRDVPR